MIIGIVAKRTSFERTSNDYGVNEAYYEFAKRYSKKVMIITNDTPIQENLDLLILPGGADVDTMRYTDDSPSMSTGKPDHYLEWFDTKMLPVYIENETPIFGICRGMQTLSVLHGAELYQDIYHVHSTKSRGERVHGLNFQHNLEKELRNIYRSISEDVNSLHHQAVNPGTVDPNIITVLATSEKKVGTFVEAISINNANIAGVQYHPEELESDVLSDYLIERLLEKSLKNKNFANLVNNR